MNITFMVGNGFDVGLGMDSRFSDFFPQYIEESKNKPELIKVLSERIQHNSDEWSYFEEQLGEYTSDFRSSSKDAFLSPRTFLNQFRDFEVSFIKYLNKQEENISFDDKNRIAKVMQNGLAHFWEYPILPYQSFQTVKDGMLNYKNEDITYNFISFNYTQTLENCLSTIPDKTVSVNIDGLKKAKIGKIIHVHGLKNEYPIMGVNDSGQISNKDLANDKWFCRYLIKPEANKANRTRFNQEAEELLENSQIICIYGMSMGKTDKKWWQQIMRCLARCENRQMILFKHAPDYSPGNQFDRLQMEDDLIDHLGYYYCKEINIDIDQIVDRIHLAINENVFEMCLHNGKNTMTYLKNEVQKQRQEHEIEILKEAYGVS